MNALQPGLIPGLPDLSLALRFAIVAILACGVGFLTGARRAETALFTGWGVACLGFVGFGCLTSAGLTWPMLALAAAGCAGLIRRLRFQPAAQDGMALPVLALAVPLLLILLSLRTTAYDDFSFWAPNLIALCLHGRLPDAAHPLAASFMPAYPRGIAISGYATWLLVPDASPAGMLRLLATGAWWNILVMLAAAAALARNLAARLRRSGQPAAGLAALTVAALALLLQSFLNPGFISKMTLSNMGDGATGSGLAMLTALLFELGGGGPRRRILLEIAGTAAAVIFIRQDNLALLLIWGAGAGLGLLLWGRRGEALRLGLASVPALAVWLIWAHYAAREIPGGAHSLLPPRGWHWADYPATLQSAVRVLLSKGVYTLLALFFLALFLASLRRARFKPAQNIVLTAVTVLIFGNFGFIMFTYLATSFTPVEVRTAVTLWRFLAQTAPAEMVALACLAPLSWLGWLRNRPAGLALCLIAAWLPVALLPSPYTFRTDLRFDVPAFLGIGQELPGLVPPGTNILLLDNSDGSGYVAWMIKFGLLELAGASNRVEISLAPQLAPGVPGDPRQLAAGQYVLVTQSGWRPPYFADAGILPWHAYLFRSTGGTLELLRDWPIPRYGRKY